MQWIFVLCGCIFLLSLTATYQVCSVSLKAGQSTYNAVEMGRTEGIAALPPSVIMERGACEAGLEQGEPPTCLPTCPHLLEGLRTIAKRQEPGRHATATREDMRRVRRAAGRAAGRPVARADAPQHHRHVGHRTARLHRPRHEAPCLPVVREVAS